MFPIALAIGMMRDSGWLVPTALMVAMALAATLSWRQLGQRTFDPPDLRGRADGRRLGVCLPACRPRLADRHAHVFLCRAGVSRRLLRLSPDPRRHGRGRAASSGAELPASGGGLSRRRRSRPRRSSRRHSADRGRRAELAGGEAVAACSRRRRRRPPRRKRQMPPKPAPISSASTPNGRPSRTATRRGANSPPASSARSAASSRRSRLPPAKCRACHRPMSGSNAETDAPDGRRGRRLDPGFDRMSKRWRPRPKSSRRRSTASPSR